MDTIYKKYDLMIASIALACFNLNDMLSYQKIMRFLKIFYCEVFICYRKNRKLLLQKGLEIVISELISTHAYLPFPSFNSNASETKEEALNQSINISLYLTMDPNTKDLLSAPFNNKNISYQTLIGLNEKIVPISRFIKYRLVGSGSYGKVYKATDTKTLSMVAIKSFFSTKDSISMYISSTIREMKGLLSLRHENIIELKCIAIAEHSDDLKQWSMNSSKDTCENIFLVMEYIPHDLHDLMRRKNAFNVETKNYISRQLFNVLSFLKDNHVLHRDIKPSNILVTSSYQIKLIDFGFARPFSQEVEMTDIVCSLWYRPPELLLGCRYYDYSIDIWSAACIVAELFMESPLFPENSEMSMLYSIFKRLGFPNNETFPGYRKLPYWEQSYRLPTAKYGESYHGKEIFNENEIQSIGIREVLNQILIYNPKLRLTPVDVLNKKAF